MREVSIKEERNKADTLLNSYINWLEKSGRLTIEEAATLQSHINGLIDLTIMLEKQEGNS